MSLWKRQSATQAVLSFKGGNTVMEKINATHLPGGPEFDARPLLQLVDDIFIASMHDDTNIVKGGTQAGGKLDLEDKTHQEIFISMVNQLIAITEQILCEISNKALVGSKDIPQTTLRILKMLSSHSWDAKLVLTLAALARYVGDFWLIAQIYTSNNLARSIAILKEVPLILDQYYGPRKHLFEALRNLIRDIMDVAWCLVEFKEIQSIPISQDLPSLSKAVDVHIPTTVYRAIKGVVICASCFTSLTGSPGHDQFAISATEANELSSVLLQMKNLYEDLKQLLDNCREQIEEKNNTEAYQLLLNLFEMNHIDNIKVLKALIYAKDDIRPLVDGISKKRVDMEVLRRKTVLLLVSGLDMSPDELSVLEQIYHIDEDSATAGVDTLITRPKILYEIVWIPVVDYGSTQWTSDAIQRQFEALQSTMPWFTVQHPSLIEKAVIRFIKEVWHFRKKPILVVVDPYGKVACPNAIPMMWIWGSHALPFTSKREEDLWKETTFNLDLVIDSVDPLILNWIEKGKYIILYGGDDVEWVREFIKTARNVAKAEDIALEMAYVGKSTERKKVRRVKDAIINEKLLSHYWLDPTMVSLFWTRIESMLFSLIQLGKADENNGVSQGIKKLLSYDKEGGWALVSKGSEVLVNGHRSTIFQAFLQYDLWKGNVGVKGFDASLREHHEMLHRTARPCWRLEVPITVGGISENMGCPECDRVVGNHVAFRCCHGDLDSLLD